MRSSDYLFRLIKSLTKGERRNFKLFARLQEGDKKYIQLFDAINRQKDYDEQKLLQQFKGERFTKQFSVPKNYLYNYLLKTLVIFQKDQQSELTTLLNQVRVLISKNLYGQAHKLVRKAKLIAERQERFLELIELLQHERTIYKQTAKIKEFRTFIALIQEKELETLKKQQQLIAYQHLFDQMQLVLGKSEKGRSKSDLKSFQGILSSPLMVDESKTKSTRAKLLRLNILSNINRYSGDISRSLELIQKVVAAYESGDSIRQEENLRYIMNLSNLAILYFYNEHDKSAALKVLEKLKSIKVYTPQEELRVIEKYYRISLALAIETGEITMGLGILKEIQDNIEEFEGKIRKTEELGIYYLAAYFYLSINEPNKALSWVNKLLNEPKTELRTDLQAMARILNLVIHYELGNLDLVHHNVNSSTRFIYKRDRLYNYEKATIKLIRKLADSFGASEREELLKNALNEFNEILKDPFERKAQELFNAVLWINSRLQKTSMAHLTQQKQQTASFVPSDN